MCGAYLFLGEARLNYEAHASCGSLDNAGEMGMQAYRSLLSHHRISDARNRFKANREETKPSNTR
jgi:hypothetical protein